MMFERLRASVAAFIARADSVFWRVNWILWYRVYLGVPWRVAHRVWRLTLLLERGVNRIPIAVVRLAGARAIAPRLRVDNWLGRTLIAIARAGHLAAIGAGRLERWAWRGVNGLGVQE